MLVSDNHTGLTKVNPRKYLLVAMVATFSVWYAQHAQAVHAIDVVDSLIYGVVQMVFGSLGGLMVFFIGSFVLVMLPAAGAVNFFLWRHFYGASLCGFWLGINLINVSILNLSTGNLSELLCDAGYVCLALAALAGVVFSRESAPAQATAVSHPALPDYANPAADLPAFAARQPQSKPAWALPQSGRTILAVAALFGLYTLYLHGGDWLGALITPGASKDAWPNDFKAALAQAHAEHKPILLHFTGSDWCPACQELDRAVISTSTFRDYAAKNLIFVEVDMPHEKFQPGALVKQNNDLCQEFEIQGFPTVIILNGTGKNLGEMVGYGGESPKAYIASIEKFIKADGAK